MINMAETSVTDFFTWPKFGRMSGSTNVWTPKVVGWVLPDFKFLQLIILRLWVRMDKRVNGIVSKSFIQLA